MNFDKYYYQNFGVVFTPDYTLFDFTNEHGLEKSQIVQMFQEDKVKVDGDEFYKYLIIYKCRIEPPIPYDED